MKLFRHFINGEFCESASGRTFDNRSPLDNELIGQVCEGQKDEVNQGVSAARQALSGTWGSLELKDRIALLNKVADRIDERAEEFLAAECLDTGKPYAMARTVDIPRGAANFRAFAGYVAEAQEQAFETETPDGKGAHNYTLHQPKGVIAIVTPWNLPLLLMTFKVAPALACGNTVVVKPSEETPATATLLGEVMNECGIPAGVFNVVHGHGPDSAGEFLTTHKDVDAITFTGETCTGETIMRAASLGLRNVSMECGGKNAGIIFADCDLGLAVEGTIRSAFLNCGQVCLGTERLYVERSIFSEFTHLLTKAAQLLQPGKPDDQHTNFGPLISTHHRDKVLSYYRLAVEEGAEVVCGGGIPAMEGSLSQGAWIEPTIWTGLSPDARVVNEEIFGPCCHIAPFDSESEVITQANNSVYGLCAAVWTQDDDKAKRLATALDVGVVWINSWYLRDLRTPFGGAGQSGIGREGGLYGLDFYTELKNVCVKN